MSADWRPLGAVAPTALAEARLKLHHAAQIVSGVGRTLLPKQDDDSHTNLGWDRRLGALVSRRVERDRPFSAALEFVALRLMLLDENDEALVTASLRRMTVDEGYAWLGEGVAARLGHVLESGFAPLHYELPDHPVASGARFVVEDQSAFSELARWFHNADLLFAELRAAEPKMSEVRCWPHHFDLGALITLDDGKQIGLGMSPGDSTYEQPYLYCSPYPQPSPDDLPALDAIGHWHTEGFVSVVLPGDRLVVEQDQPTAARAYLAGALQACRTVLGVEDPNV